LLYRDLERRSYEPIYRLEAVNGVTLRAFDGSADGGDNFIFAVCAFVTERL
jgi:hypothetical protein